MPRIIPRAEWGWDGWAGTPATVPTSKRTELFVHYEGPPTRGKGGPGVPRAIHAYHKSVGWSGIGYSWVVTQDGVIYEGRGWDLSGAHCPNHNVSGWSVQIHIGGDETPSPAALASARWLYDQAVARAGRRLTMLGHLEGGASTSCPGKRLLAWVHAGMPAGAPSDTTPQTVWGEGETGPDVARIQRIVGATVDGDWGPKTTAAVKAWQTAHGLEPDGLWGPLCEAAASKTPTIPTLTEDDMRIITDGTRTALVGPGYLATLDTPEAVDVTKALVGSPVVVGNARQYDVWVAACTQGRNVTAPTVTAEALQAAIRGALTGLIGGAK